jgi:hypothetical protein
VLVAGGGHRGVGFRVWGSRSRCRRIVVDPVEERRELDLCFLVTIWGWEERGDGGDNGFRGGLACA